MNFIPQDSTSLSYLFRSFETGYRAQNLCKAADDNFNLHRTILKKLP